MKKIKIAIVAALFLFAMSGWAMQPQHPQGAESQEHKNMGHGMAGDDPLKMLTEKLSLTADQQAKVKTILDEHHQQMHAFMKDESLSQDDKMKKMHALHDDVQAKIGAVLTTDEQKKKFAEMQKDMSDHMGHGHMGQGHMGEKHDHDKGGDSTTPK